MDNFIEVSRLPAITTTFDFALLHHDPNFISGLFISSFVQQAREIMKMIHQDNYTMTYELADRGAYCVGAEDISEEHKKCGRELMDKIVEIVKNNCSLEDYGCVITKECRYEQNYLRTQKIEFSLTYHPDEKSSFETENSRDHVEVRNGKGNIAIERQLIKDTVIFRL